MTDATTANVAGITLRHEKPRSTLLALLWAVFIEPVQPYRPEPGSRMLKQAVGVLASIVAIAIVSLAVAVLVRLSWYPRSDPGETPPKA